ncbi:hypothetical protein ACFV5N_25855 [Streptomyces sp. NPDC059853]|uniref:hypothetical protein n=1 Tax=Streptomyces sp. NPDC059853 TaxID=3346973 RepID=UPI00364788D7
MKSLLWCVFSLALIVNPVVSLVLSDGPLRLLLNIVSGLTVLAAGTGLWLLRDRGESRAY